MTNTTDKFGNVIGKGHQAHGEEAAPVKTKDTPPNIDNLIKIKFTETVPDVSWYRHVSWEEGQFKRFRHCHTMCQSVEGFEFFNEK
jgi:hypothetical protein